MGTTQRDLVHNQREATADAQVSPTSEELRQGAILMGETHRLTRQLQRQAREIADQVSDAYPIHWTKGRGTEPAPAPMFSVRPAPDGYIRRTPFQPLRVAAGDQKRIIRNILRTVVVVGAILFFLLWLLWSRNQ